MDAARKRSSSKSRSSKLMLSKSSKFMSPKSSKATTWSAGTLLWARMRGYCAWPAVSTPPPAATSTYRRSKSKGRLEHHVHFLGYFNLRGWVSDAVAFDPDMDPFRTSNWSKRPKRNMKELESRYNEARTVANLVQEMTCGDRLKMLGHHHLYEADCDSNVEEAASINREKSKLESGLGEESQQMKNAVKKSFGGSKKNSECERSFDKKELMEWREKCGEYKGDYKESGEFALTKIDCEMRESTKRANDNSGTVSDSDESLRLFLESDSDDTDDASQGSVEDQSWIKKDPEELQDTESKTKSNGSSRKACLKEVMYSNSLSVNGVLPIRPGELCWALLCRTLWWPCILSLPGHGGAKVIEAGVVHYHVHFMGRRRTKTQWVTQLRVFEDQPKCHDRNKKVKANLLEAIAEAESIKEWSCERRHLHYVGKSAVKKRKIEVENDLMKEYDDKDFNDFGFPHGEVNASLLPSDWKMCQGVIWTPHGRTFISLKTAVHFLMQQISRTTSRRQPLKRSISTPCLSTKHPTSLNRGVEGDQSSFVFGKLHQAGRLKVQERRANLCGEQATERVSLYHDPFMPKNWNVLLVRSPMPSNIPGVFYMSHGHDKFFNNRRDFLQSQIRELKNSESIFSRQILDLEHVISLYALKQDFTKWLCNQKALEVSVVPLPDVFLGHVGVVIVEKGDETSFLDADTREFVAKKINLK